MRSFSTVKLSTPTPTHLGIREMVRNSAAVAVHIVFVLVRVIADVVPFRSGSCYRRLDATGDAPVGIMRQSRQRREFVAASLLRLSDGRRERALP